MLAYERTVCRMLRRRAGVLPLNDPPNAGWPHTMRIRAIGNRLDLAAARRGLPMGALRRLG